MKKAILIPILVIAVIAFSIFSWFTGTYNHLVDLQESVSSQWSQVENVYQRRSDLIPNLVSTVKGYAKFEKETLTGVIEARAKATSINLSPDKLDPESIKKFQDAQSGLSSALSRLMAVVENYPNLKANQNFLELQSQLEGTENRITVERMKFNGVIKTYNTVVRQFPSNIIAGISGFEKKGYFEAEAGAEKAPKVNFSDDAN